jgi:hypothetical protein
VGIRLSSPHAIRQRKRIQMNRRKYHRNRMNWNSGRLTQTSHQPAGENRRPPSAGTAYQVATSRAPPYWLQIKGTPTR